MASFSLPSHTTGEDTIIQLPRIRAARARIPVIWIHGGGGTGYGDSFSPWNELIADDRPVVSGDWGGPLTWGNDLCAPAIELGRQRLVDLGLNADKVILATGSMGHAAAARYAADHLAHVAGLVSIAGLCDLVDLYTNEAARGGIGHRFSIATAWGVTYPDPLPTRANIAAYASTFTGLPVGLWYSTGDDVIYPPTVEAWAAGVGATATLVVAGSGVHADPGLYPVAFPQLVDFLGQFD